MSKNSLNHRILALAVPAIVANITTPLLSLVDVAIVGRLGSAAFVAAIAVGGTMFNLLYWLFGFLRTGTSGLTAQAEGRGDERGSAITLARSLLLAMAFAATIMCLSRPLGNLLLNFIDPDEATADLAWRYFTILIFGAPASLGYMALTGWFIGRQNTRATMWVSLLINVTNIAASLLLVFVSGLGMIGVATGTLIAQWTGFITALIYAVRHYGVQVPPLSEIIGGHGFRRFFSINSDIFLRTLCLIAVTLWFTRAGAKQGAVMLAVNTLLMQFFTLFSYFMDGFAFAGEALCGKAVGKGDGHELTQAVRALMKYGMVMALLFTTLYFIGGDFLLNILTTDTNVLSAATEYSLWALTIPAAGFMAFTWDGIFIGATLTRFMLVSIAGATIVFFSIWWVLTPILGNHALWLAFISYLFFRGLLQSLLWYRHHYSSNV